MRLKINNNNNNNNNNNSDNNNTNPVNCCELLYNKENVPKKPLIYTLNSFVFISEENFLSRVKPSSLLP